jgi:tetratricopeptide (TPR) repeat protein
MPRSVSSSRAILIFVSPLLACLAAAARAAEPVKAWEEDQTIPTYGVAPPDVNPRFYAGRVYQGARASFYPYPIYDRLTGEKSDRIYRAVCLENRYLKISVLPELGGRIFTALDKTNGYDFFYRQHVIKPALIGMLGAWISGGVEWNVPHHHRASSFLPVDHVLEDGPGGARTLWVGEIELRHRMKWLLGITLRPDRSTIEMEVKVFNRTALPHSFLFWMNPAVHAGPDYQVIFPPSTEWAVQHGKPEFASWPIARQRYGGVDYTRGVDISWWKNHPSPVSFFCWNSEEDFFGGYDHGKKAGVIHVADHHLVPGKKFFEWGNGPDGEMWTKILTDADGPYLELMAGAYSDNQPDYSWIQPGEVKVFRHVWYPVREMGGVKSANADGAVNLEVEGGRARISLNSTAEIGAARAVLATSSGTLFQKRIDIGPGRPFTTEVSLPEGQDVEDLRASLYRSDGREIVFYRPSKKQGSPMPAPVKRPAPPGEIKTAEELYLAGLRLEQLHSPAVEPAPYYEEAVKRDPLDVRANTALAILALRHGKYEEAEARLGQAIERATANYIRPKDGEPFYYRGVALRAQGKLAEAADSFWRAVWSEAWKGAGYGALAEIACARGDFAGALDLADRALSSGSLNTRTRDLKAAVLRNLGRLEEAERTAAATLAIDPLDFRAANEVVLARRRNGEADSRGALEILESRMRGATSSYLELAADYAGAGLFGEAVDVLERAVAVTKEKERVSPLVLYWLGYSLAKANRMSESDEAYRQAARMPPDLCFPFQMELVEILRNAIEWNPSDARAPYYLGNLLYDHQPEEAIRAWERSAELDPSFATVHRNLALAYAQARNDIPRAIACLEKAVERSPGDARLYFERDVLYEAGGVDPAKRLLALTANQEAVARRDDALTREIVLLTGAGRADEALSLLGVRRFHNWEGKSDIHDVYVDACLERGRARLREKRYDDALRDFRAALEYPENLEVGKPYSERRGGEISYLVGTALEAKGDGEGAKAAFVHAAAEKERSSEARYYQALALGKLGRQDEARAAFEELLKKGLADLVGATSVDYFAKFGERRSERARKADAHHLAGLGYLGLGRRTEAMDEFGKALAEDPGHLGARREMGAR